LAGIFPLLPPEDLATLAANIREHGLQSPIILHDGQILDGRNRYRACRLADVEPRIEELPTDRDPLAFVLSANLHRRHLTTSQRALIAAKLATLPHGRSEKKKGMNSSLTPSIDEVAEQLSVGTAIVKQARTVLQDATQTKAVESGQKSVHAAAREIRATRGAPPLGTDPSPKPVLDSTGYQIPEALRPLWNRRAEVDTTLNDISRAFATLKSAREAGDILFSRTNLNEVLAHLESAYDATLLSALSAVCPACDGHALDQCPVCHGRGFLNADEFNRHPATQNAAAS
jgi:ParB-like chromosome segregation protein Spo0J